MRDRAIRFEIGAAAPSQFPPADVPEVVFVGRSNVGKSSLLNTLTGRKNLARVSSSPGKTQQINFFRIGDVLRFVDLPGYGFAHVSQTERRAWKKLIEAYLTGGRPIALILQLLDARHPLQDLDAGMIEWLVSLQLPVQTVATKADKLTQRDLVRNARALLDAIRSCGCGSHILPFSAVKGTGKRELLALIGTAAGVKW